MQWQVIPVLRAVAWIADAAVAAEASHANGAVLEVATGAPALGYVEPMTRRRLSPLARAILHCAGRCQTEPGTLRIVAASRHGEVARTLEQLGHIADGEELSPTAFSLSVHNATAGILSTLRGNRAPHNAVAAGDETFGWGLLDAYAALAAAPEAPVLYLYGDDRLPDALGSFESEPAGLHAVGLLLGRDAPHCLYVRAHEADGDGSARSLPETFLASPSAGHWTGRRTGWAWRWDAVREGSHVH